MPSRPQRLTRLLSLALLTALSVGSLVALAADYTPAHRKQLREAQSKLGVAARHIRADDTAAAKEAIAEAESIVESIRSESGYDADHAVFRTFNKLLEARKEAVGDEVPAMAGDGGQAPGGLSYTNDIKPILDSQCTRCHGAGRQSAGIRLDSYAVLQGRGRSGPLVTPGLPDRSTLYSRMITDDILRRMPKNGPPVESDAVAKVKEWIIQGAKDDSMGAPAMASTSKPLPKDVVIPKPTGSETVSFTKDIAPFFLDMCVGCHSGPNARSGLSLVSFHDMMVGGDSGAVILPGDRVNSRLFRLTGGLENPRMPDNRQVRLTRKNYEDLKTWFDEGNVFDGDDPKAPLTDYVKTEEDLRRDEIAAMSPKERIELTKVDLAASLKRAMPSMTFNAAESEGGSGMVHVRGTLDDADLQTIAETAAKRLEASADAGTIDFGTQGGYSIVAVDNQYTFNEMSRAIIGRDSPPGLLFFSRVVDDEATSVILKDKRATGPDSPTLEQLADIATLDAIARSHGNVPRWLASGYAIANAGIPHRSPLGSKLTATGTAGVKSARPDDVLSDDYNPATLDAAGYVVVLNLAKAYGGDAVMKMIEMTGNGRSADDAVQAATRRSSRSIGELLQKAL